MLTAAKPHTARAFTRPTELTADEVIGQSIRLFRQPNRRMPHRGVGVESFVPVNLADNLLPPTDDDREVAVVEPFDLSVRRPVHVSSSTSDGAACFPWAVAESCRATSESASGSCLHVSRSGLGLAR